MQPGVYYGFILNWAEYFGQEGNDETQMLNLLYVTMNAIRRGKQDLRLIRCIFELRTITISGEAPQMFSLHGVRHERESDRFLPARQRHLLPKLWKNHQRSMGAAAGHRAGMPYISLRHRWRSCSGFTVNEEILDELERLLRAYLHRYSVEKKMKTLQILDVMK